MTDAEFRSDVQNVFREVFEMPSLRIHETMQAKDVEGWDSLNHVTLIMAIEERFAVRFSTREVMGFANVGEMLACLKGKLAA
jgi:acyl carrier protein